MFWGKKLLFRNSGNIRTDPSAFPFPGSFRHDNHSATRKHPTVQRPADSHDPDYTSHTGFRELWNCTTATVCLNGLCLFMDCVRLELLYFKFFHAGPW